MIIIIISLCVLVFGLILAGTSVNRLKKLYKKYFVASGYNKTALEFICLSIMQLKLNTKVTISEKPFSDAYASKSDIIILSKEVAENSTVSAISISAHELGHAIQKRKKNVFLKLSSFLFVINKISSFLLVPSVLSGIILLFIPSTYSYGIIILEIALALWAVSYLLKIALIPLEFNASKIAYNFLKEYHILNAKELKCAKKLLKAAGLTYVASLFYGIYTFFELLFKSFKK